MTTRRRPAEALALGSALLIATATLGTTIFVNPSEPWIQPLDDAWHETIATTRNDAATWIAESLAAAGNWPWTYVVLAIAIVPLLIAKRWRSAVYVAACVVATVVVVNPAVKELIERERPPGHLVDVTSYAFPSGHSSFAAVLALSTVLAWRPCRTRWIAAAVVVTVLMMWSRTYLSVHWLTDTIAGAILGFGIAVIGYWLVRPWLALERR